jgi:hypothetical protein
MKDCHARARRRRRRRWPGRGSNIPFKRLRILPGAMTVMITVRFLSVNVVSFQF